jgi:hypothetical protein
MVKVYKEHPLKKYAFLLIGLALMIGICYPISAVNYKLMSDKLNQSTAQALIDSIDETFYKDIKIIKFYDNLPNYYYGYYYTGGVIAVYCGLDRDVTIHELAHGLQEKYWRANRLRIPYSYPHDGLFYSFERWIYEESEWSYFEGKTYESSE